MQSTEDMIYDCGIYLMNAADAGHLSAAAILEPMYDGLVDRHNARIDEHAERQ
jgi:hypothetical protein